MVRTNALSFLILVLFRINVSNSIGFLSFVYKQGYHEKLWTERGKRHFYTDIRDPSDTDDNSLNYPRIFNKTEFSVGTVFLKKDNITSGEHYWQYRFDTLSGQAIIGLINRDNYNPKKPLQCLCYGGGLKNGQELLVPEFGPAIQIGDTIGMLVVYQADRVKVYFDIAGESLGLAFDVPASAMVTGSPIVQLSGPAKVSVRKMTTLPLTRDRKHDNYTGIQGPWVFRYLNNGNSKTGLIQKKIRSERRIFLDIIENKNEVILHTNLIRNEMFTYNNTGTTWDPIAQYTINNASCSSMEFIDESLLKILKKPEKQFGNNHRLVLTQQNLTSVWGRYVYAPQPYIGNPFNLL